MRPYYSTEGTYSNPNWISVYGEEFAKPSYTPLAQTKVLENSLSNHPNPFNPATNIFFSIQEPGLVIIKVFDLTGQQITELINEEKEPGSYSIPFDASNLPSGIYIYTINAKNFNQHRKMLLMK
ncbi:MAG: T9SS type A sorting domain-containing protein [Ignavibacteriaceae bacterium]|nr:T9SS type A sorting domain-containing protein [Ignavibacteriaceae bacterium]